MEEPKEKWGKSQRRNGRVKGDIEGESKERSSNQQVKGVEVELVNCNAWIE
jgi:hypothetical protein